MLFRSSPTNRPTRLVAGIILVAFGAGLLGTSLLIGLVLMATGLVTSAYQGFRLWRERPDPYDLSRLWDEPAHKEEPEEDNVERNLVFCHHCGASMPEKYAICPECGTPLGR